MKCVPFDVNVCLCEMLFLTCTEHTSTTSPVNEMTISIKINILIKFGTSIIPSDMGNLKLCFFVVIK